MNTITASPSQAELDVITKVATKVRKWCVRVNNACAEGTSNLLIEHFPRDLCGMCAIATGKLLTELHKAGIKRAVAHSTHSHCYVMVDDTIVDVTATQFSQEEVLVITKSALRQRIRNGDVRNWWKVGTRHTTAASLRKHQQRVGWIDEQICLA